MQHWNIAGVWNSSVLEAEWIQERPIYSFGQQGCLWLYYWICGSKRYHIIKFSKWTIKRIRIIGAPWREKASNICQRLKETGIVDKIISNYFPSYLPLIVRTPVDTTPKPFTLDHFLACFIFLAIGNTLSILIFVFEVLYLRKGLHTGEILMSLDH